MTVSYAVLSPGQTKNRVFFPTVCHYSFVGQKKPKRSKLCVEP